MDLLQKIVLFLTSIFSASSIVSTPLPNISIITPQPTMVSNKVTLIAGGDVMLGRSVMGATFDSNDFLYPFHFIADEFKSADISFINLENPITKSCKRHVGGFTFCADPRQIEGLKYAGIDVITLANNHTYNYGKSGIEETKKILKENNFLITGEQEFAVKEVNGIKFGFLGFDKSQQTKPTLTEQERTLIIQSDEKVDVLVVGMHWGTEYQNIALPGVKILAKEIVDLGADVIIGSHPHWVQDYEMINGKPVYYSLGNLIFDQMWSEETKKGMVVKMYFENGKFIKDEKLSTYTRKIGQPEFVKE